MPSASSFQRAPMPRHALRVARSAERRTRFRPCPWGSSRSPEPPLALQERSRRATATPPLPNRGPHSARGAARRGEGARRGRSRGRGDATRRRARPHFARARRVWRAASPPAPHPAQVSSTKSTLDGGRDIFPVDIFPVDIFGLAERSGAFPTGTDPARAPARGAPRAARRPARIRGLSRGRAAAVFCVRVVWRRVRQPPTDRPGKKKKKKKPPAAGAGVGRRGPLSRRKARRATCGGGERACGGRCGHRSPRGTGLSHAHTHTLPPHLVSLNPHARALPCAPHARVQARCGKGSSGRRTIREDGRHAEPGRPWRRGRRE